MNHYTIIFLVTFVHLQGQDACYWAREQSPRESLAYVAIPTGNEVPYARKILDKDNFVKMSVRIENVDFLLSRMTEVKDIGTLLLVRRFYKEICYLDKNIYKKAVIAHEPKEALDIRDFRLVVSEDSHLLDDFAKIGLMLKLTKENRFLHGWELCKGDDKVDWTLHCSSPVIAVPPISEEVENGYRSEQYIKEMEECAVVPRWDNPVLRTQSIRYQQDSRYAKRYQATPLGWKKVYDANGK